MSRKLAALSAAAAFILAGCGGSSHQAPPPPPTPKATQPAVVVNGVSHPCDPKNAVVQCFLPQASGLLAVPAPSSSHPVYGVDFGWGGPSCATLKSEGRIFAFSYLSTDSSKNWSHALVQQYIHDGCKVGFVWETSANEAGSGRQAGINDAHAALSQYRSYIPHGRVAIDFAIDFDATYSQVASYFGGVHSVLGDGGGAYGGAEPLVQLCAHHLVGHTNWATLAWLYRNNNQWPSASCAPLEQYGIGSSTDNDRALAADYGQYPAPSSGPPPVKIHCFGKSWQHTKFCNGIRAQAAHKGAEYHKELGYLRVSNQAATHTHAQFASLQKRVNQIHARAKTELDHGKWKALAVSAHNADVVEAKLAPFLHRYSVIQGHIKLEQARATAAKKEYEGLLGKYGYRPKGH